jgi:hypothetical protein
LKDPSGFRPIYTAGEETSEMRKASLDTMSNVNMNNYQHAASKNPPVNYKKSASKGTKSGVVNSVGGYIASNVIKEKMVYKEYGTLTLGKYTSNLSKGVKFSKRSLGIAGSIGFTVWDTGDSLLNEEYVGAGIDIATGSAGTLMGCLVGLGTAALVTASTPIWLAGAIGVGGFAVTIQLGVYIDEFATFRKNLYYGR